MKNAILFKINRFFAYLTVSAPVPFFVASNALSFQTKMNQFFDYDWSSDYDWSNDSHN